MWKYMLLVLCGLIGSAPPVLANELKPYRETLSIAQQQEFDKSMRQRLDWIMMFSEQRKWGYKSPKRLPVVYVVDREYMTANAQIICPSSTEDESRACLSNKFAWIDDARDIYVLRDDDVHTTASLTGIKDFPFALWIEMVQVHELTHYVQLEGTAHIVSTLPCALVQEWEKRANLVARQWLHQKQTAEAERLNVLFRENSYEGACQQ